MLNSSNTGAKITDSPNPFHDLKQPGSYLCYMEWTFTLTGIDQMAKFSGKPIRIKKYMLSGENGCGENQFHRGALRSQKCRRNGKAAPFPLLMNTVLPQVIYHLDLYRLKG
jgi:tRNA A37 threonylcarbamoyladenosine biosynthesis protein TsaE